jgi:uncharacterized protein (DUF885 family)
MSDLKKYFNDIIKLNPSFGSFLGYRKYDGDYENGLSPEYRKKYKALLEKYKNTTNKVLRYEVKMGLRGLKYKLYLIPFVSHNNEIINFTFFNQTFYPLKTARDYENLVRRHYKFIECIDSGITNMREGMKCGMVLPKIICEKMIAGLDAFYKKKGYLIMVPKKYEYIFEEYGSKIKEFIQFLKGEYLKKCIAGVGICNLPNGKEIYRYLVKEQTTTNKSPEDIYEFGLKEVSRIKEELEKLKRKMGFECSLLEFYKKMKENTKNYCDTKDEVVREYARVGEEIRKNVMPKYFWDKVKPYELVKVPKDMEDGNAGAFYYPGNKKRVGTFYINTRDIRENPKYSMMALTLHEGIPGHHYQYRYMIEKKLPFYKIYGIEGSAYAEGWGLYAESLGEYDDYSYFGRLSYEIFRALRLVVDTGIHYYGWSYKRAVNYMMKYISFERSEIDSEVERYICIPAQALCYKIGETVIKGLRDDYMRGEGADIRDFHRKILENGVVPLNILEDNFRKK